MNTILKNKDGFKPNAQFLNFIITIHEERYELWTSLINSVEQLIEYCSREKMPLMGCGVFIREENIFHIQEGDHGFTLAKYGYGPYARCKPAPHPYKQSFPSITTLPSSGILERIIEKHDLPIPLKELDKCPFIGNL